MVRTAVWMLALCAVVYGCGSDDDAAAAGGAGGGAVGGGTPAGSGVPAGAGGMAGSSSFVPGSPTFGAVYQEVFVDTGCSGGAYCHGGPALTGGLEMTDKHMTYTLLINVPAASKPLMGNAPACMGTGKMRVVPGDPVNSLLMDKISSMTPSCGQGMPPTGMIAATKIEQVRMWIANGAHED